MEKVKESNPCIGVCKFNPCAECIGCGRSREEVIRSHRERTDKGQNMMKNARKFEETSKPLSHRANRALLAIERTVQGDTQTLIAILDAQSTILAVNGEWAKFASANGAESWEKVGVGARYLSVCEGATGICEAEADEFETGLKSVLNGERDGYELVSPCHAPTEQRWFLGRVVKNPGGEPDLFAILHLNVTEAHQRSERSLKMAA